MADKSYSDNADFANTKGGLSVNPDDYKSDFNELKQLLADMDSQRQSSGSCGSHTYTAPNTDSHGDIYDKINAMSGCSCDTNVVATCQCNGRTVCNCDSRTSCNCNGRTSCNCNSRTSCSCQSRTSCSCWGRATQYCNNYEPACDCNGRSGSCSCHSRTDYSCTGRTACSCDSRTGSCYCEARCTGNDVSQFS